jgi:outer membrane receptor protein involved in Fe transport
VTLVQGGNPEVQPEVADTYTAGFVYRPGFLPGLDVSVDWLSVNVAGSIEQFGAQEIVNACYIQNNPDQCANITLDPSGELSLVNQTFQNVSKAKISGVDMEVGYARPIDLFGGGEQLSMRVFASYLDENSTTNSTGVKTDRAGQVGGQMIPNIFSLPRLKMTGLLNYTRGPLRGFLQLRYIGNGVYDTQNGIGLNNWILADNTVGSITYVDTRVSYNLSISDSNVEIYGNVTNLFDRAPPLVPYYSAAVAAAFQYNAGLYDVVGRRFTLGVNVKF